jgi:hypothetical protein
MGLTEGTSLTSRYVFNCTYSNINTLLHRYGLYLLPNLYVRLKL